ncbi:hypothetical protein PENTCL1PPCAC_22927, partial [Pristionchus entomophagus]
LPLSSLPFLPFSMAPRVDNSERAEQLIHNYYDYLSKTPWIAPIVSTYERTKHSHIVMEEGLGRMESSIVSLSTLLISMSLWSIHTFYIVPIKRISNGTRRVINWTSTVIVGMGNWMVNLCTLSIGMSVVTVQAALTLSIGGASGFLDAVEIVKRSSMNGLEWIREMAGQVDDFLRNKIDFIVKTGQIPLNFTAEWLHSLFDLIQGFMDNKMEMPVIVSPHASLLTRGQSILTALSNGLSERAHSHVIDPAHAQLESLVEQTKKSLVVLEVIREKGEWAVERVENVSNAVSQWKSKIEEEAKLYRVAPEVILLKAIHSSTQALTLNILTLKEKNSKVFGDVTLFDGVIYHLESIASSLKEKKDIYEVRDELITQTRDQLVSLSHSLRQ